MSRFVSSSLVCLAASLLPGAAGAADRAQSAAPREIVAAPIDPATPTKVARPRPLSPEQQALLAIQESARQRVRDLMARISSLPQGPGRAALEREVVEVKRQAHIQHLSTIADFARRRGDLVAAREAEDALARFLNPKLSATTPQATSAEKIPSNPNGGRP